MPFATRQGPDAPRHEENMRAALRGTGVQPVDERNEHRRSRCSKSEAFAIAHQGSVAIAALGMNPLRGWSLRDSTG
jgi:hypothetical protein